MRHLKLIVAAASVCALSACVIAPYPRQGAYYPEAGGAIITDVAPPAPYAEAVPVIPYPGAVWIGGYWGWSGSRHNWVPGRWERGRHGYAWNPHHWENRGGRWRLEGGGWRRH